MTRHLTLIDRHQNGWHTEPVADCELCQQEEGGPPDTGEQRLWEPDPDDLLPPWSPKEAAGHDEG